MFITLIVRWGVILIFKKRLSANTIKHYAIFLMTIDHIAFVFISDTSVWYHIMRFLGRTTAPVMCYFIAEGFRYTRSRRKYLLRMFIFSVVAQPVYFIMMFGRPPNNIVEYLSKINVMYTFLISLLILFVIENKKISKFLKPILIAICYGLSIVGDWSFIIPTWVLIFYKFKDDFKKLLLVYSATSILMITYFYLPSGIKLYHFGVIFSIVPLYFYSGKRGKKMENKTLVFINKWCFYIYYPLHISVLILIKLAQIR